mgnify:CR=1 FL=1
MRLKRWVVSALILTVRHCFEVGKMVLDRSIDVGFISKPSDRDELESDCAVMDELVPIAASNHRLARRGKVNSEELRNEMFSSVRKARPLAR